MRDHGESADELGYHTELAEVFGAHLVKAGDVAPGRFGVTEPYAPCVGADALRHDILEAHESSGEYEE